MEPDFVNIVFGIVLIYLASGLLFGLYFILWGIYRFDQDVSGSKTGFRLLILPGAIALWPYLIYLIVNKRKAK